MQIRESGRRPINRSPVILGFQRLRRNCHRRWRQYEMKMFGLWSSGRGRAYRSSQAELEALASGLRPERNNSAGDSGFPGDCPAANPPCQGGVAGGDAVGAFRAYREGGRAGTVSRGIGAGRGEPAPVSVPWYSGPLAGKGRRKGSRDPRLAAGGVAGGWAGGQPAGSRPAAAFDSRQSGGIGRMSPTGPGRAAVRQSRGRLFGLGGARAGGRRGPGAGPAAGRREKSDGRPSFPLLRCLVFAALIWGVVPYCTTALESQGVLRPRDSGALSVDAGLPGLSLNSGGQSNGAGGGGGLGGSSLESAANQKIRLYEYKSGKTIELDLEEYLVGVVAGEMPASFEPEALKAQAVAARTYSVSKLVKGASPALAEMAPAADITNDTSINQTWLSEEERQANWGKSFAANEAKIRAAVRDTAGVILLYDGEIIDPLYHSSCGGEKTEDPVNVWGGSVPYLRSVACSGHEDPYSSKTIVVSLEKADQLLGTALSAVAASASVGSRSQLCQVTGRSSSGRVLTASISGKEFSGAELRSRLELPSANFRASVTAEGLEITSKGYGHGVGMCQYGANDYARKGLDYRQILLHYYTGCALARLG